MVLTKEQIVMVEHYMAVLPFKPNNWVLCSHQLTMLEDAIALMEANVAAEAGLYLIPKAWKKDRQSPGWR